MTDDTARDPTAGRSRREPPPFRRVTVRRTEQLSPRLRRLVLDGPELAGFPDPGPASSVRLLLPAPGGTDVVLPKWTGNEFRGPDGERAPIRTFTPRRLDEDGLTIDVVIHAGGAASDWAATARTGTPTAVSGPGRGYDVEDEATSYLLAGDETALPAIGQLLEVIPHEIEVDVHVEIADDRARIALDDHPNARVSWHVADPSGAPGDAFVRAIEQLDEIPDAVWVAGEAAAVQRVRTHLADARDRPRNTVTVRGYWKHGRAGT